MLTSRSSTDFEFDSTTGAAAADAAAAVTVATVLNAIIGVAPLVSLQL